MASIRAKKTASRPSRRTPPKPASHAQRMVELGLPVHVLDIPFGMRALASQHGASWDKKVGAYLFYGELPAALHPYRAAPYSWEARVQRGIDGSKRRTPSVPKSPMTPRPHQQVAIDQIRDAAEAGRTGFLLADDVGLGKTLATWEAVRAVPGATNVLIVCPLAVVPHWRRTIEAQGDGGLDIVVLNYERLGKVFEIDDEKRKKVKSKKGLAKMATAPEYDVIVWDESHRCKNPTAARSKLAAKLNAKAGFVLWLSATAGQNPLELSYLAPLLAESTGSKVSDLKEFEKWCAELGLGVRRGTFGRWDWTGEAADLERVRALLFEGDRPAGLRRRPEDIAGWPEINRILTPLGLDTSARELYEQAWTEFRDELDLHPSGRDPKNALVAALRLRQKSSLIRVDSTVELVLELLDNGHHVAVSVAFVETLEAISEALAAKKVATAHVHGGKSANEREAERMRFQTGQVPVVLFTVEEGISLHQGEHDEVPRSEVIHDLRWSAIQMAQIEGRCHRDGRYAPVYWAYADETIEERIAGIVCKRIEAMKAMVGDDTETVQEIARLLGA
ncbi:MAG: DEAD/DEAH box helicase [Deltaproteobacteria bacterium]|nr:MAG: DEAD/DEAH box helicase [Deltaproteobacteria bacterium]